MKLLLLLCYDPLASLKKDLDKKNPLRSEDLLVNPLGFEPRTPTLKV